MRDALQSSVASASGRWEHMNEATPLRIAPRWRKAESLASVPVVGSIDAERFAQTARKPKVRALIDSANDLERELERTEDDQVG